MKRRKALQNPFANRGSQGPRRRKTKSELREEKVQSVKAETGKHFVRRFVDDYELATNEEE